MRSNIQDKGLGATLKLRHTGPMKHPARASRFLAISTLIFAGLPFLPTFPAHADARAKVDPNEAKIAAVGKCTTADQMDCIESVTIITSDGKRLPATQSAPPSDSELDSLEQVVESGASKWEYKTAAGVDSSFVIDATLTTPKYLIAGGIDEVEVQSNAESEAEGESTEESNSPTEVVSVDTRFYEPKLSISAIFAAGSKNFASKKLLPGETLEIVVRTSWLEIDSAYIPGRSSQVQVSSIANGKRITMKGSEVLTYDRQSSTNLITGKRTYSVVTKEDFEFLFLHPKAEDLTAKCYEKGFKVSSTNAASLSLADENDATSLRFVASGYAYKPDNSLVEAYAVVKMPVEWISCKYPTSELGFAKDLSVKVATGDGSSVKQNSANAKAQIVNKVLEITIDNFHIARTEILVEASAAQISQNKAQLADAKNKAEAKAKADAEAKAKAEAESKAKAEAEAKAKADAEAKAKAEAETKSKPAAKKMTITCVKGKATKKVTAVKPKCPKGFVKKS